MESIGFKIILTCTHSIFYVNSTRFSITILSRQNNCYLDKTNIVMHMYISKDGIVWNHLF